MLALKLLCVLCIFGYTLASPKIEMAFLLFRHGDRSPTHPYPNYPHTSAWPQGNGQLTPLGMQQQYQLGNFIRNRYIPTLISPVYRHSEIYVLSTDFDRTIMSALSQLSGIFPPNEKQTWNPFLPWQPIPVHVLPDRFDELILNETNCPKYEELMEETRNSVEYIEMSKKYAHLFEMISHATDSHVSLGNIERYIDTIVCDFLHNITLPVWANENFGDLLLIQTWSMEILLDSKEKKILIAGIFLFEFWARIDEKINNSTEVKAYFYSAHDSTLITILSAFGIWNGEWTPYATMLIIELVREGEDWFIQFLFRNSSDGIVHELSVPKCGVVCPVEKLRQLTADLTIGKRDWEMKCGLRSGDSITKRCSISLILQLLFIFVLIITILVMVLTVFSCKKKPDSHSIRYSKFAVDDSDDTDTTMNDES